MKKYTEDDNELLYLITCGSETALEIMYDKFENMIRSRVIRYNVPVELRDDYAQEGRIVLHKAIKFYRPHSLKTFNRFFDLIWCRHIITMLRRQKSREDSTILTENVVVGEPGSNVEPSFIINELDLSVLSEAEKKIYHLRIIEGISIEQMCIILNKNEKQIYNTIQRFKQKLKKSVILEAR